MGIPLEEDGAGEQEEQLQVQEWGSARLLASEGAITTAEWLEAILL